MHRRTLFERLGRYDTSYRMVGDYELLLRARRQLNTAYMPMVTVLMRAGGVSDGREALVEQARAKAAAGGRSKLLAALELHFANAKFALHPLVYALRRIRPTSEQLHANACIRFGCLFRLWVCVAAQLYLLVHNDWRL